MPTSRYLVIPKVSSERRAYIPIGYVTPETLSSDLLHVVSDATLFHVGILTSAMHMAWVRTVCGRLKSDYRYSGSLVYNNFPWPDPSDKEREAVDVAAQAVMDARSAFPEATLADLYDPLTMPAQLVKAHAALDRAVDRCYRRGAFQSDRERVEHLFTLYEKQAAPLLPAETLPKRRTRRV